MPISVEVALEKSQEGCVFPSPRMTLKDNTRARLFFKRGIASSLVAIGREIVGCYLLDEVMFLFPPNFIRLSRLIYQSTIKAYPSFLQAF